MSGVKLLFLGYRLIVATLIEIFGSSLLNKKINFISSEKIKSHKY